MVGQLLTFTMELKQYPNSIPLPMCRIYYGDGRQSDVVRESSHTITAQFYFPGTYMFKFQCRLNDKLFQASGEVQVEANLERPSLSLWFAKAEQGYMESVDLSFTHTYTFPIYYHLTIGDLSLTHQLESFDADKFTEKKSTVRRFVLSQEHQAMIGPGKHHFTMVMENNVSSIVYSDEFTLLEPVSRVQIATANLVGIHPSSFVMNVTVGLGAPVSLLIQVFRGPANQSVAQMRMSCERRCPMLHPRVTLPDPGTNYVISVIASNEVSSVSEFYRSLTAMPLIYDVFVTSLEPLIVGPNNQVFFFVRGDLGDYSMTIHINHQKQKDTHFQITTTTQSHDFTAVFPMNPQSYTKVPVFIAFEQSGKVHVHVTIANAIKTMYFQRTLHVLYEFVCDIGLRIRDGNEKIWVDNPITVESTLQLNSDAHCYCDNDARISYTWEIFRVTSSKDVPFHQLNLKQEFSDPNFVLDTSSFLPGLYVVKLAASIADQRNWQLVGYQQDFALVQVERQEPNIVIEGGTRRQIGELVGKV